MYILEVNLIFKSRTWKNASLFAIKKMDNPTFLCMKQYEKVVLSGKRFHCRKAFRFLYIK